MYTIYEYQAAQNVFVRVGQSEDTNHKRAIIKATSRYRFNNHDFEIHFSGDNKIEVIDNRPIPEYLWEPGDAGGQRMKWELRELVEVEAYLSKVKWDKPQTFGVDPWGYEQTNYENLTIVGHVRGSLVALVGYNVYSIAKAKYNKRDKYILDSVRSTSWEPAYTDQTEYNAYYGH